MARQAISLKTKQVCRQSRQRPLTKYAVAMESIAFLTQLQGAMEDHGQRILQLWRADGVQRHVPI